eukprot:m.138762 g.138762  ORF g.138762 m.138762 type:complete len:66 (+) comp38258_c0_seq8:1012-1209(+)
MSSIEKVAKVESIYLIKCSLLFCSDNLTYYEYVMKVLLPEACVMLLMEFKNLSQSDAEEAIGVQL